MRALGIVRQLDKLGRFSIPIEARRERNIDNGDRLEFFVGDNGELILRKYVWHCIGCGMVGPTLVRAFGIVICPECIAKLNAAVNSPPEEGR